MQTYLRPNNSFMKYEPPLIDDFEIRRISGTGDPTVLDSDSAAPPINGEADTPSTESDGSPVVVLNGFKRRDRRAYQPGVSLSLPLSVISCLKHYVARLEAARGRYVCLSALNSCLESFANFDDFCAHLRASHSPCRRYRCLYCGLSAPFNEVKSHIDQHFEMSVKTSNRYPCPYCFEKNTQRCQLVTHIEREHKESLLKYPFCRVCAAPFQDVDDYCLHVERSSFDLYHCPHPGCFVKSPDKMLVVEHYSRKHERPDQSLAVHFRSTRHFSCAADVESRLEKLVPFRSLSAHNDNPCPTSPQEQEMPVLLLECPICEKTINDKLFKFLTHAAKCNRFADGEEVEMCPEESEVQLQLFSCSSCGATATKKSSVQVHLRSGQCCGLQGRILSESVSVERLQPAGTTARRRPRSMPPPQPPSIHPPPTSPSIRLPLDSPTASVSTESTMLLKEEPAHLDNLLGWAQVILEIGALMRFPEVLACRATYSNVRQMCADVKKLSVALYGFGAGSESRFLCPTCSSSFPAHEEEDLRFGRHLIEHFELPPNIVDLCLKVLKIEISYVNKQPEVRRDAAAALVIKGEPASSAPPSCQEDPSALATVPTAPSDDEDVASPLPAAEPADDEQPPSEASHPERRYVRLLVSPPVLEQVVTMLPHPSSDGPVFRACIERYLGLRVFERGRRFFCESCDRLGHTLGFASFSELRRHLIRKHCHLPEHLTVFCLLLVRQQMMGSYAMLPDELQMRVLALPGVQQTQISYRLTQYLKQREEADRRFPPMSEIIAHVERLCEGNAPAKRKGATLGRLTPSAAPEKAKKSEPEEKVKEKEKEKEKKEKEKEKEKEKKEKEKEKENENKEKPEEGPRETGDSEEAELRFDFDKFTALASNFKMDAASQMAVKRKMSGLKMARITCTRIRADRIGFKCACGKYEEVVQNVSVTDGPRRHALRAHVRISKIHWSVCLQCTTLVFDNPDGPVSGTQKRPASPQLSSNTAGDAKRCRVEAEEGDSPALMVCGFKMRAVDKRQPLAHVAESSAARQKSYCGFAICGVPWHPLVEAKQQLKSDAKAAELRRRLALLPEYRVYTLQGASRSFVCSACGFASDYTSRDVKRHLLVLHLGINVELVTSILNFAETRSFMMQQHSSAAKDLVGQERWAGCAEPQEAELQVETGAGTMTVAGAEAGSKGRAKGRKRLVPRLPAIARKTKKVPPTTEPSPTTEPAAAFVTPEKESEAAREARLQPFVRLVRLSPKEIATGRLERPPSPTPFAAPSASAPTPSPAPEARPETPAPSRKSLTVLRVQKTQGDVVFRCSLCTEERCNKVDLIAHMSRVHANLNQSWRFGCKACGAHFTGMTMYKAHVDAKHLGTPVLLNRVVNKDWQAEFPVVDVEEN